MRNSMAIVCPRCNKDDTIQRISAIVQSGRAEGTFSGPTAGAVYVEGKWGASGSYTTLSGYTISELAKLLAAPPEPRKPSGFGWMSLPIGCIGFIGGYLLGAVLALPGFFISGMGNPSVPVAWQIIGFCEVIIAAIVGYGLVIVFIRHKARERLKVDEARYVAEKLKWNAAIQRWNRMYYCHRDGIAFDPDTSETCEPSAVKALVYA